MSSLETDRLLDEGPAPVVPASGQETAADLPTPRRTRRPAAGAAVTAVTRAGGRARTAAAAAKPATRTTTARSAAARTLTPGPAAAKTLPRARTATKTPAGTSTATKTPAAKPTTAKNTTRKPPAAKPTSATTASATTAAAAPARRPSPVPRAAGRHAAPAGARTGTAALAVTLPAPAPAADGQPTPTAARGPRHLRRAPLRRPALVLAAALVAALGVSIGTSAAQHAAASPGTVSVAAQLGLTGGRAAAGTPSATDQLREMAASRAQRQAEETAAAQEQAAKDQAAVAAVAARPKAVLPVNGARLTTCYCMRWGAMHWGIDLAAPLGTPEYAAVDGVVLKSGAASGFGQAIYIQGTDGDVTVYGHMEKLLVQAGQVVRAGDEIALMGSEGESTGSHLHFEVHQGSLEGPRTDPVPWLAARGVQVPGA